MAERGGERAVGPRGAAGDQDAADGGVVAADEAGEGGEVIAEAGLGAGRGDGGLVHHVEAVVEGGGVDDGDVASGRWGSAAAKLGCAVVLVAGSGPMGRDEVVAGIPVFGQLASQLADVGYFALGQTLLLMVGFTLGALIRNSPGAVVGYMVWFRSFSTFSARSKLYLEDLYVRPAHRGRVRAEQFVFASAFPFAPVVDYTRWFRGLPIKPLSLIHI